MKRLFYILAITILYSNVYSQNVTGTVYGDLGTKQEALEGAILKWINTTVGTITDAKGIFGISPEGITDKRLIVNYIGYHKDTILVGDLNNIKIVLSQNIKTGEIDVEGEHRSTFFDNKEAKTEIITSNEILKDACCDLSGCFGRNSSVDVAVTDIITDSKELKVLGLDGVYTQVLIENMPIITGLNTKYSISSYPGTLINKIMVTKGANSVLQGYENISGIINVLLKDEKTSDRIFFNAFMNNMLEKQVNANFTNKFGKRWKSIFSLHSTQKSNRVDENHDNFLDNPLTTRYVAYNKWNFGTDESSTQFSAAGKLWIEDRVGGEKGFDASKDEGSGTIYGQTVHIKSGDLYSRYSRKFENGNSLKILTSASVYDLNSFYGITRYDAIQNVFNGSLIYEFALPGQNFLKTGFSYKQEKIDENISFTQPVNKTYNGRYLKNEYVPGVFLEHAINFLDNRASIMTGIRYDYHNEHKGIVTPRMLIRYTPASETVIRASIGTGFRTVDLFNEYSTIMASARNIIITEKLEPEKMLNYGIDLIQYYNLGDIAGSINLDIYRTEFYNKVIPDYDTDPSKVFFSNTDGKAYSNIIQVEVTSSWNGFDLKAAYKYLETKYPLNGVMTDQVLNPKHRVLSTFSYTPQDKSWGVSAGLQWFGKQKIPSTASNPVEYRRPSESEPYTLVNMQLSKNFKILELYAGVDNMFDFMQEHAVLGHQDPFGPYFDTSLIWGPTKGREFYAGIRLKIN